MRHAARLTRRDHRTLRGSGFRASAGPVTVHAYPEPGPRAAGFAVSTAAGGSVVRNRIRRRLRAALAELDWQGAIVVSARAPAAALPFGEIRDCLGRAIDAASRRAAEASGRSRDVPTANPAGRGSAGPR